MNFVRSLKCMFFDPSKESVCLVSRGENILMISITVGLYYLLHMS